MNMLLVAIDTLRADHLSSYGYVRNTSPRLDALADEGILFEQCISQTAHTMPTFTTIVTGQYPFTHGIVGTLYGHPNEPDQVLDDETPVLAQMFREGGWLTAAFDNLMQFGCGPKWFVRGYDFYVNTVKRESPFVARVWAEQINARLIPWLRMYGKEPFFLFVHYWDPHQPYNQPERFMDLHRGGPTPRTCTTPEGRTFLPRWGWTDRIGPEEQERIDRYDGEISYVDAEFGKVLDALKDMGLYKDTYIVVTADHGEDMEEHNAPFEHREIYRHTTHVPLIVKPAAEMGVQVARRIEALVGHIDLMPTLLDWAGLGHPTGMDGVSLTPLVRGDVQSVHDHLFVGGGAIKQYERWRCAEVGIRTAQYTYFKRGTAVLEPDHQPKDLSNLCAPPWRWDRTRAWTDRVDFFNRLPKEELYDLSTDPYELSNIVNDQASVAALLDELVEDYVARNPDRFLGNCEGLWVGTHRYGLRV